MICRCICHVVYDPECHCCDLRGSWQCQNCEMWSEADRGQCYECGYHRMRGPAALSVSEEGSE